jgi:hypothetical protein
MRRLCLGLLCAVLPGFAGPSPHAAAPASSAEQLYEQLGSVGLDPQRVYRVREASLDREDMHITLDDGTIAFTSDVMGRVTGAFFEGEGEILVVPPDRAERSSLALFTGAAVLEEQFNSAYIRFNDDTFQKLQSDLRPTTGQAEFVAKKEGAARGLAHSDAFRLLLTFSRDLPPTPARTATESAQDRFLHARLSCERRGIVDAYYDSTGAEQVTVGQLSETKAGVFFDLWTSFAVRSARKARLSGATGTTIEKTIDSELNVLQYRIRAAVNLPHQLSADALMEVEVKNGGQRTLVFELSRFLELETIEADGRPLEFVHNPSQAGSQVARQGNDAVAVIFPEVLRTGQRMRLRFVYKGDVLSEAGGGLIYVGARGSWYPHRGLAMAQFDLQFRYPLGYALLATGKRAAVDPESPSAAGEQVARWISERPIPLAGFNLGQYVEGAAEANGVRVASYAGGVERSFPRPKAPVEPPPPLFPPAAGPVATPADSVVLHPAPSPAKNAQRVAEKSLSFIQFMARRSGPFPYSGLALTQMPGFNSQGWPGLVFLSSLAFLSQPERAAMKFSPFADLLYGELMQNHETAHQWWGDNVTWSSYRDEWVDEALSNYCAMLMMEAERPQDFAAVLDHYRAELLRKNKEGLPTSDAGSVTLGIRLYSSRFPSGYDDIAYGRGTWLFHMLREMLRTGGVASASAEEPFWRVLRGLQQRFSGRPMTYADVQAAFEAELPRALWFEGRRSLNWFNEGWVNGTVVPQIELAGVKFSNGARGNTAAGRILQENAPRDLVTSVPIYGERGKSLVFVARVFADGPETRFRLTAPAGIRKLVLDPYQTILRRVK